MLFHRVGADVGFFVLIDLIFLPPLLYTLTHGLIFDPGCDYYCIVIVLVRGRFDGLSDNSLLRPLHLATWETLHKPISSHFQLSTSNDEINYHTMVRDTARP